MIERKRKPAEPAEPAASATPAEPAPRQRFSRAERRRMLVEGAAAYYADHGLEATTRDVAASLGVSQGLLYKYFAGKDALRDAVYEHVFQDRWQPEWDALLVDVNIPLRDRLIGFYSAYAAGFSYVGMRLFMLAGLSSRGLAGRYSFPLTDRIFKPVIAALRIEAGLDDLATVAMTRGERELAMMLHGGVAFLGIRKFIYQMPLPDDLSDVIELQVDTFLGTAAQSLIRIHEAETLNVPLLR
jgi:AcrR family transcriptional regulator